MLTITTPKRMKNNDVYNCKVAEKKNLDEGIHNSNIID